MALTDNLISVWEMDEASGDAVDSHGSNTLTETSGTIAATTGKINGARDFEATGDSEYFEIADNADVSIGDTDWTISAWVYGETLASNPVIASKGWSNTPDANSEFVIYYSTSASRFRVDFRGSSTTNVNATNHGAASAGNWYHVVAWHDSVNNIIGIAVNAGTANTFSKTDGVNDGTASFVVGSSPSQSLYWDGLIDQVAIWRRVLTSDERTSLYNSGNGLAYSSWGGGGGSAKPWYYMAQQRVVG